MGPKDIKLKDGKQHAANQKQEATNNKAAAPDVAQSEEDKFKRFENEGVVFKAKLIGSELVMEPRGDKMCQNSIQRLKAIIKGTNSHKKRIVLKISFDGVKIYDEKSNEMLHHHEVAQISYIASDDTDNRTFGYVSDVPAKAHLFICFKTAGPAINVMSVISSLFEASLEKKNRAMKREKELEKEKEMGATPTATTTKLASQDSMDLIGDSGILEGDASIIGDTSGRQSSIQARTSSVLDSFVVPPAPGDSFNSTTATGPRNNVNNNKQVNQSASTADLLFDDLFAGLSDPIIVDKNDSLITYKPEMSGASASQLAGLTIPSSVSRSSAAISPSKFILASGGVGRPATMGSNSAGIPPGLMLPQPNSRSHQPASGILLPPSSLPRPAPSMKQPGPTQNRSLIYNHSSVSLSDAALTRQPSLTTNTQHHSTTNDNYMDRYAVFNDIDSLPSIFESTSLGNVNKVNPTNKTSTTMAALSSSNAESSMFRQRNPFDDDFFA